MNKIPNIKNLEVTNFCNLNCPVCIEKVNEPCNLKLEVLDNILVNNEDVFKNQTIWLHFRGEPLINNNLFDIIDRLSNAGAKVRLSTNGILLNDEKIDKIVESDLTLVVVSVMTLKKDDYIKLRGRAELDKVLGNIKQLNKSIREKNSKVILQAMGLDYNQPREEIESFIKYFNDMGIDVAIHKYSSRAGYSRLNFAEDKKDMCKKNCEWIYNDVIILSDGSVTTCYHDLRANNIIGNLKDFNYSIEKLWNSKEYNQFRINHEKSIYSDSCKKCNDFIYYEGKESYVKIYKVNGEIINC